MKKKKKVTKKNYVKKLFLLIIVLIIGLLVLNIKDKNRQISQTKYSSPKTNDRSSKKNKRISYNFEKILRENFLVFENKEIGFNISYPLAVNPYVYSASEAKVKFVHAASDPIGAINFSLISQPPGAYEIYDGLSFDIVYYENIWGQNFEKQILQKGKEYDPQTNIGKKFDRIISINGMRGIKLISCCHAGETKLYYFLTKGNKYFIEIIIFSAGQDKEKFNEVANKILNSLIIY